MNIEHVNFEDLVDLEELQVLFEQFSAATGYTVGIMDHATNEVLVGSAWRSICVDFHRACLESKKHCDAFSKEITTSLYDLGEISIRHCKHGLAAGFTPIIIAGKHFADLLIGQVLFESPDLEKFHSQALHYEYDEEVYLESLAQVPVVKEESFSAMMRYVAHMAEMIVQTGLANFQVRRESSGKEALLQSIFSSAPVGIGFVVNRVLKWTNKKMTEITGYTSNELADQSSRILYPSDEEFERVGREKYRDIKATGTGSLDTCFKRKDGSLVDVHLSSSPIDPQDLTAGVTFTVLDITDRIKTEERFRELYNNMSNGVAIYEAIADGQDFIIRDMNQASLLSSQVEYDEVVGKSVLKVFPGITKMGLFKVFQRVWKTGVPEHFPSSLYEDNRVNLWVENYVCKIPSGEIVAIYNDITERKKAEDELIRSKKEWAATFDVMADIVTIQDKDMRIVRANKAAQSFLQLETGELKGKHCYEVFTGVSEPCLDCPLMDTLEDIGSHSAIIHHEHLGKIFQVSSSAILDEQGDLQYLVHVARDITDKKKMEEDLFQAHKMEAVGTLAGGIAHDFNNILTAIMGYAELARCKLAEGSDIRYDVEQVIMAGKRATGLVQQILSFSRKAERQRQLLQPHLIVKEAMKMLRASLPTTLVIEEKIDSECGFILADPTNIHQIVVNLCTNAFHSMKDEKGILTVGLYRQEITKKDISESNVSPGPFVVLSIGDTGHGMDKETLSRIFEPYFTTKEVGRGSGLGLAVIHGIVKDHNGFIRVESAPGQGTTFHIYMPALEEAVDDLQEKENKDIIGGTERILFVDDEESLVMLNTTLLEKLGYQVTGTTNSTEALEKVRSNAEDFDLVITDQTMPELPGVELAKEILKIKPEMPIILCTGYSSVIEEQDALELGIKKYAMKPLDLTKLAELARQALDD